MIKILLSGMLGELRWTVSWKKLSFVPLMTFLKSVAPGLPSWYVSGKERFYSEAF